MLNKQLISKWAREVNWHGVPDCTTLKAILELAADYGYFKGLAAQPAEKPESNTRLTALNDVAATVGATHPELMDYLQCEIESLRVLLNYEYSKKVAQP